MKKIIKFGVELLTIMGLIFVFSHISVFATSSLPISDPAEQIFQGSNIPVPPSGEDGQKLVKDLVFRALSYTKIIVAVLGILFLTIIGYSLVVQGDDEAKVTDAKHAVTYTVIAFVLLSMSQDIARIFDMEGDTILQSPQEILQRVRLFDRQVEIIITFIKYIVGAYAVVMILRAGLKLVTSGGDEGEVTNQKKSILYSLGGLILINIGDIFINRVIYKVDRNVYSGITGVHPQVDAKEGIDQIVGITNLVVSFVGPIAVLMLIAGAVLYATAAGEDDRMEKAKRILISAAVAIVIIYGSFAIVSTVISGRLQDLNALVK